MVNVLINKYVKEKLFKEINDDLKEIFFGVCPSDKINKFTMFEKMMPGKKYPFLISKTGTSDQGETHWWSIMNISPKSKLFFDSFRIEGIKHFIGSDDKKIFGKILKGIQTIDDKGKKLTLCKLEFSMNAHERLKDNEIKKSAEDLFHLIYSFGKNEELTNFVNIWMLEDPIQMPKTDFLNIFFTKTYFFPAKKAKFKATRS